MIVVDATILAALYLENPAVKDVELILVAEPHWFAPRLWRSEFRNVLIQYIRHHKINLHKAMQVMEASEDLMQEVEGEPASRQILQLAHTSGCSVYDCEYVALARGLGTKLITLDRKLLAAFPDTAITPTAFLATGL